MPRAWPVLVTVLPLVLLAGCRGPSPRVPEPGPHPAPEGSVVAQPLGQVEYVRDAHPPVEPVSTIVVGSSAISALADDVRTYGAGDLAKALERQPEDTAVLTVYFDGCTAGDPVLARVDGVLVPWNTRTHGLRACARPIDTFVAYAVPVADLQPPVEYRPCRNRGALVLQPGPRVEGEPVRVLC